MAHEHEVFINENNLSQEEFDYLIRGDKNPKCKCGDYKKIIKQPQSKIGICLGRSCGKKECEPNFGKKRPRHSEIMKKLANEDNKFSRNLIKKGQILNPEINGSNFKRKRLTKHLIPFTEETLDETYSNFLSSLNTNLEKRKKEIISRFESWETEYKEMILEVTKGVIPTIEWLDLQEESHVHEVWSRIHGINTIRFSKKVKSSRNGFFKTGILSGFKHNGLDQETVFYRSGLEKKWIQFFEEQCIEWAYEPFSIFLTTGFYVPDFLVYYKDKLIVLEAKGGYYNQNKIEYFENKIIPATKKIKNMGMFFVLSESPTPSTKEFSQV